MCGFFRRPDDLKTLGGVPAWIVAVPVAAVLVAVHHAEVIALRVGEPYGTLVLTLVVTHPRQRRHAWRSIRAVPGGFALRISSS